jgi:hypothetical protein
MSDRYVMTDTNQVITNMADLGYHVAGARGPKFRTQHGSYGYHLVDFRLKAHLKAKDTESPRLVFINSYNGVARARVAAGVFRWICSNGLIAGDTIAEERVTHIGDAAKDLIDRVSKIAAESEKVLERIGQMKSINLTKSESLEFTRRAVGLAYEKPDASAAPMFNLPRRAEDLSLDLWTTFNRVQENLVRGGVPVIGATGQMRLSSPVKNVQRDVKLNRSLWDLMESFSEEAMA